MIASLTQDKPKSAIDSWLDKAVFPFWPNFTIETLIIILIISLTLVSRFTDLGVRVMAHDEVNHVVPSFDLYEGRVYSYDPVTHGPFQFHMIAASYFLFGDSDFSSALTTRPVWDCGGAVCIVCVAALPGQDRIDPGRNILHDLALYALLQPLCAE